VRSPPFFATNFPSWLEHLSNFAPGLFNLPTNAAEKNYIILLLQRYNEAQMLATNPFIKWNTVLLDVLKKSQSAIGADYQKVLLQTLTERSKIIYDEIEGLNTSSTGRLAILAILRPSDLPTAMEMRILFETGDLAQVYGQVPAPVVSTIAISSSSSSPPPVTSSSSSSAAPIVRSNVGFQVDTLLNSNDLKLAKYSNVARKKTPAEEKIWREDLEEEPENPSDDNHESDVDFGSGDDDDNPKTKPKRGVKIKSQEAQDEYDS
jgi:hypothetical protein